MPPKHQRKRWRFRALNVKRHDSLPERLVQVKPGVAGPQHAERGGEPGAAETVAARDKSCRGEGHRDARDEQDGEDHELLGHFSGWRRIRAGCRLEQPVGWRVRRTSRSISVGIVESNLWGYARRRVWPIYR